MAELADVKNCHVVEVGSGPGSLTRSILLQGCSELDCVESLAASSPIPTRIHNCDIFKFDFCSALSSIQISEWNTDIIPKARIIGNLPFNISIGLLLQWLRAISLREGPFQFGRVPLYLTFQKEVAQNLASKTIIDVSRLTIMAQAFCKIKKLQFIHRSHFTPVPKVDAVFIELVPLSKPLVNVSFEILEQVVKGAFQYRGKRIRNSLNDNIADKLLLYADLDPTLHTCMLGISDWNRLCDAYVRLMTEEELPLIVQPMKSPPPIVHHNVD